MLELAGGITPAAGLVGAIAGEDGGERLEKAATLNRRSQAVCEVIGLPFARAQLAACHTGAYPWTMLDWRECPAVERVPSKVSGAWVFNGTRVPVKALFENLEDGARVDDFLEWFPGVTRQQVESVLEHAERSLAVA